MSTPEIVSCETLMGDICAWLCDEEEPLEEEPLEEDWLLAEGWAPLELLCALANFPLTFMTVMLMLPVTLLTPSSEAIWVSFLVRSTAAGARLHTRAGELLALAGLVRRVHAELLRPARVHLLLLAHGDVGADAVERLEHLVLGLADAGRVRGHGDHERHADGKAERCEQRLAMPPAQLPEHVGEEHAASSFFLTTVVCRRDGSLLKRS